jgi:O-antigen ligase
MVSCLLAGALLGILIAGSMAGYGLLGPVILVCFLIGRAKSDRIATLGALFAVSAFIASMALLLASSPRIVGLGGLDLSGGTLSRPDSWARTLEAIGATMPFGSGLGSFEGLFPHFEDPSQVTSKFMNHAHNDYLEFTLEYGLPGVLLLAGFFCWFIWRVVDIWGAQDAESVRLQRAASVAVLIVLVHSCVDYPARTGTISGLAGLCLGIIASRSDPRRWMARGTGALARYRP